MNKREQYLARGRKAKKAKRSKAEKVRYYWDKRMARVTYVRQTTPDYGSGSNEIAQSFLPHVPQTG